MARPTCSSLYGQHNEQVLRELLGLSDAEIAELERSVVFSCEPRVPTPGG